MHKNSVIRCNQIIESSVDSAAECAAGSPQRIPYTQLRRAEQMTTAVDVTHGTDRNIEI